ncbi:membrane protein DedA, SNARE-associated domain [Fodinibius roseus]|uniref:Membrane protein DedA, SNARE-associated domain n=1 Tax=Fodinibius roseus TaxID=1194090 RepID=A0A1M5F5E8_9BACT|nr:alpha/beta fold hydrolase [Fodinibius roseus]SHF86588.1 membrane protein DedA, SNARE-associated domain [Fodinibius roseus]
MSALPSAFRGWRKYLLLYGGLLLLSHLSLWLFESPVSPGDEAGQRIALKAVSEEGKWTGDKALIAYEYLSAGADAHKPAVVLLPGGPEGPEVFDPLISRLKEDFRLIIPHLPGHARSGEQLPDYSFRALADYSRQLADTLGIANVHLVGYGLGGASAIHWAHDDTSRIRSVTLIASIGVQELELLGGYTLNHAVHGIQLGAVWLLHNAVPHFGLFNALDINVPYAKSYYESDQRPIRSYLKSYKKPMLIVHGTDDPLVPDAVAREHHRIVPQSELQLYKADHEITETHNDSVANDIRMFVESVEAGEARTGENASQKRLAEAAKPFSNVDFARFEGISLMIIMLIIILATLVSEDLTCIGAGLLAARGLIGFWPATLACLTGIFIGDVGLYLAGRFVGRKAIRQAPFKWMISEGDLDKSAEWFKRRGPMIIMASRFLPGSRLPTYFSAGVIRAGFWMFIFYFLLAAVVWTPILVGISQLLGNELLRYFSLYQDYALWAFLALILLLIIIAKAIIPAFSYRGRRFLVSRYRRLTHWQHWPSFLLYMPVFFYILYLGWRYRCPTLFTLANPGIPDGGVAGESKSAILSKFDRQSVAPFITLPGALPEKERLRKAHAFMDQLGLTFPVVIKPDVGERGKGVRIIDNYPQLESIIRESRQKLILQEYIEGQEYGIFYYRFPDSKEGEIFSITIKHLVYVVGDGQSTVEELILADNQAVTLAKYHLNQNREQLYEVPEKGERWPVVRLGTHARGAVFEEGSSLKSGALKETLNNICSSVPGFCFGRMDIKVPTASHLRRGEDIDIIEVNGVTSESTNIYDKHYSLSQGLRILCQQWRLAFEIGAGNREKGAEPPDIKPFLERLYRYLVK